MKARYTLSILAVMCVAQFATAQETTGYYSAAEHKHGQALLQALENIVGPHTRVKYDDLWNAYKTTDSNSDKYIIDIYSDYPYYSVFNRKPCSSSSIIGECLNREHSMPKSWWGSTVNDQYSDIYHLYPTDSRINNQRSNYPYGECSGGTRIVTTLDGVEYHGKGKLGTCTYPGYTGKVFEPDDEYKGDLARTYFYMAAAYNSLIGNWSSPNLLSDGARYPIYTPWTVEMLLKWHRMDPVSEKEINRNNAANELQENRNPFIDHPELAEHIWGNKMSEDWTLGGQQELNPMLVTPQNGDVYDMGYTRANVPLTMPVTIKGVDLSKDVTVSITGAGFTMNNGVGMLTLSASAVNAGTTINVTYNRDRTTSAKGIVRVTSTEFDLVKFNILAVSIAGIPAQQATDVTESSFVAHWTNIEQSTGNFYFWLYDNASGGLMPGYPVAVSAAAEQYLVTGLEPNTTYRYRLTSVNNENDNFASNDVLVTTADVVHILAFDVPASGLVVAGPASKPIGPSQPIEVSLYTENIDEEVTVAVEENTNFELSRDRHTWGTSITLDPEGESFFIRLCEATYGRYSTELSASTAHYEGDLVDVSGVICTPKYYYEHFAEATVVGQAGDAAVLDGNDEMQWRLYDGELGSTLNDRYNGTQSLRLGSKPNSSLEMITDKADGAGQLSFAAASYGSDPKANLAVYYSVTGGDIWVPLGQITVKRGLLRTYVFNINVPGRVRVKIEQLSGERVNIDDIMITDFDAEPTLIVDAYGDNRNWDAVATTGGIMLQATHRTTLDIYDMDARQVAHARVDGHHMVELPAGVYVVVNGKQSKKVIVK
ncbi:MAG: endonuclease [Muribaculaceae bacterium]|nr:endonuclease [Muribaculaceae bacterium]